MRGSSSDFHSAYFQRKRTNRVKRAQAPPKERKKLATIDKKEADSYRLKAMLERRERRIAEISKANRDFRRYLRTLDKLLDDEDVASVYSGVLNIDLGDLAASLHGILKLEDRDRFLLVEETHKFIDRIDARTFGKRSKRGYVRGDFGFDLPKGETLTLTDVKTALRLT